MRVLIWVPPWSAHGDPHFYRNCLQKHLIPQANLLTSVGWDVDVFLPELLEASRSFINNKVNVIDFSLEDQIKCFGSLNDLSLELYQEKDKNLISKIANEISTFLSDDYDVVLLWETPVPFLEAIFNNALIIQQMPGIFSREPYPHTVTFDPIGLYKRSALFLNADEIKAHEFNNDSLSMVKEFKTLVRSSVGMINPYTRADLDPRNKYKKLALLPLQVSGHYTFKADTTYENQIEFLLDVLNSVDSETGIVVTQYVTPRVKDSVLTDDTLKVLLKKWPNLIYKPDFDCIPSISQFLLPLVDQVITCSSSIGLQAFAWDRSLNVIQDTFIKPYADQKIDLNNMDAPQAAENTLAFLLGFNQPLASAITDDPIFLVGLIEEMLLRKRAGKTGLGLLPAFQTIDPNYTDRLLAGFKTDRAAAALAKTNTYWSTHIAEYNKFRRFVNDKEVAVITFDIFDTLVKRPSEVPADLYKLLEKEVLLATNGLAEDFARVRLNAEVDTRNKSDKGEITLDDIYASIQIHYGLEDDLLNAIKKIEIDLETRLIQVRPFGQKLWQIAKESGKPIYLISDMYLPENVISHIVTGLGYSGYQKLYLSSTYGARKKEGHLFDVFLSETGLNPSSVLHVGDNKVADTEQPALRDMRSYRLLRAIDRLRGNDFYKEIYSARSGAGERSRSVLAGLSAHALFDVPSGDVEKGTHFQGRPYNLGYAGLGPMLTGYMLWLGRQAKRDGITRLYFLSREGWILKQVYDALHHNDFNAVPSSYLYASRRATRVASLQTKGDVLALAGQPYRNGVVVEVLLQSRFGIDAEQISAQIWQTAGFISSQDKLSADPVGRMKFAQLCSLANDLILTHAQQERGAYLDYLQQMGLPTEVNPGIVDIGWKANMQGALGLLLGKPLTGYYYATLQGAEVWATRGHHMWAYLGDMLAANHPSAIIQNRHLIEYLTCHIEQSLLCIQRNGDRLIPVFRAEDGAGARRLLIEEIHLGAQQFARDFNSNYAKFTDQIWIDAFLAERTFASFVNHPHKVDAAMLLGHHFEDALGGVSRQYIIKPVANGALTDSVWKKGATAIYGAPQIKPVAKPITKPVAKPNTVVKPALATIKPEITLQAHNASLDGEQNITKSIWLKLEARFIRRFNGDRLFAKYLRDRDAFFSDSKSSLAKAWYKCK